MNIRSQLYLVLLLIGAPLTAGFGVRWDQGRNLEMLKAAGEEKDVVLYGFDRIGAVYYPGEDVRVMLARPRDKALLERGKLEVIGFHTGQFDPTETGFVKGKDPRLIALTEIRPTYTVLADLKVDQTALTGALNVPDVCGMYAVVLVRPDGRRTVVGGLARVLKPTPRLGDFPQIMAEYGLPGSRHSEYSHDGMCAALARLGIGLVRREMPSSVAKTGKDPVFDSRHLPGWDAFFAASEKHKIKVMITLGAHDERELPWKPRGKPFSRILPPDRDPELRQWYKNMTRRYWRGGKAGLWAVEHWNEPWEPFGISGWGGDSKRYRQLLRTIHDGVKAVDPKIKIVAACSVMNTEDKFLSGPSRKHMKMIDIMSDHYVSLWASYGPRVAEKHGIVSGETETWGVHSQVLAAQFMSQFLSGGQRWINPCTKDMLWQGFGRDRLQPKGIRRGLPPVATPMPAAVTLAAWNAIIQDRPFERLCFTTHLPYLYQFGSDEDARFVLTGKLTSTGSGRLRDYPWHQVLKGPNGRLTLHDAKGILEIRDLSGNRLKPKQGEYRLMMDTRSYFLSSTAGAKAVIDLVRRARLDGLRHVHIAPGTLSAAPQKGQPVNLAVRVKNVYNRAIKGQFRVASLTAEGTVDGDRELALAAGETVVVDVSVSAMPNGGLPLTFTFVPKAGKAEPWSEVIQITGIPQGTLPVTGAPGDWKKLRPVTVLSAGKAGANDEMERIWLPFIEQKGEKQQTRGGEVRLAWDRKHLYLFAAVDDAQLQPKQRLATWDEDQYFWGKRFAAEWRPLEPWARFLSFRNNDKRALKKAQQDPDWPKFQAFLKDNPKFSQLAKNRWVRGYFEIKAKRPKARLEELSFHYSQMAPRFINDLPFSGDTFQFAFDFDRPAERMAKTHDLDYPVDKLPRSWVAVPDTDYEFSLYQCLDGKPELWCLLAPGIPRGHYFPHAEKNANRQHAVTADASVENRAGRTLYRVALPWSELGIRQPQAGLEFGFTFRFNSSGSLSFGQSAGATKMNGLTLHPYWQPSPSNSIRWTLQ